MCESFHDPVAAHQGTGLKWVSVNQGYRAGPLRPTLSWGKTAVLVSSACPASRFGQMGRQVLAPSTQRVRGVVLPKRSARRVAAAGCGHSAFRLSRATKEVLLRVACSIRALGLWTDWGRRYRILAGAPELRYLPNRRAHPLCRVRDRPSGWHGWSLAETRADIRESVR